MTIAAERLAVIAAVTLPITALSSILGVNFIVNDTIQPLELTIWLAIMAVMTVALLIWTKRLGRWYRPEDHPNPVTPPEVCPPNPQGLSREEAEQQSTANRHSR